MKNGFFIFIDICFEIDIGKEVPLKNFLYHNKVYQIDKGGCQA